MTAKLDLVYMTLHQKVSMFILSTKTVLAPLLWLRELTKELFWMLKTTIYVTQSNSCLKFSWSIDQRTGTTILYSLYCLFFLFVCSQICFGVRNQSNTCKYCTSRQTRVLLARRQTSKATSVTTRAPTWMRPRKTKSVKTGSKIKNAVFD